MAQWAELHPAVAQNWVKSDKLKGTDIQAAFFDLWLEEHKNADLEHVPADMVMASGSGLDPNITLDNALCQLDRVAAAWSKKTGADEKELRGQIERLLREKSYAPLAGLVGVPLVNVLEVNLALRNRYQKTVVREPIESTPPRTVP